VVLINQGTDEATWARYRNLRSRRDEATFTVAEQDELTNLYDAIELQHARRIRAVIELAQLRRQPVETLMDRLGLASPGCE
jgi:ABC-type tungstate transport system permease subunit